MPKAFWAFTPNALVAAAVAVVMSAFTVGCAPKPAPVDVAIPIKSRLVPSEAGRTIGLLEAAPSGSRVALDLSSPGGYVFDGLAIIDAMDAARARGVTVVTRVASGARCGSMCVFIFAAGHEREAEVGGSFLLHGARNLRTGEMVQGATFFLIDETVRRGGDRERLMQALAQGAFGAKDHIVPAAELPDLGIDLRLVGGRSTALERITWTQPVD